MRNQGREEGLKEEMKERVKKRKEEKRKYEKTNSLNKKTEEEKWGKVMKPLGKRRQRKATCCNCVILFKTSCDNIFFLLFPEILCGNEFNHSAPNFNLLL